MPAVVAVERKTVWVRAVDQKLWREARAQATREGFTITEYLERVLQEAIKKSKGR